MTDKTTGTSVDQAAVRSRRLRTAFAALGMLPVLILLAAGFQFINPRFLTGTNLLIVTQKSSINIVLAAGMTFVILTGGIDLSVGAAMALAGTMAAGLIVNFAVHRERLWLVLLVPLIAVFLWLVAVKTDGDWRFRWGNDD